MCLSLLPALCRAQPELARVLIVDGRNNHAWEGTTTAVRQTLLQTDAFEVDVSTSPLRYAKPYPQRPRNPSADDQAAYDADVASWRSEEKAFESLIAAEWAEWRTQFSEYDVVVDNYTYRDTTGDGVADEKTRIYEGSRKIDSSRSIEHQDSGLVWAIDNWIYLSRGRERFRNFDNGKCGHDSHCNRGSAENLCRRNR